MFKYLSPASDVAVDPARLFDQRHFNYVLFDFGTDGAR